MASNPWRFSSNWFQIHLSEKYLFMKRINSGSMKFRNYSVNYCTLVKFFRLSEGKIHLSIHLYPIIHSFIQQIPIERLSCFPHTGCQRSGRSTKPSQTFFSWSLWSREGALGRTAPCLGRLPNDGFPKSSEHWFLLHNTIESWSY